MSSKRQLSRFLTTGLIATCLAVAAGCVGAPNNGGAPTLHYVGSSTIAHFIKDAELACGRARFVVDTEPESAGGEAAILEGRADLAGVARQPNPEVLNEEGLVATRIGQDAIAVVVHQSNPVDGLTRAQLKGIFSGKLHNWKEVGGPDLPIQPYIVGPASATRKVFRSTILGEASYDGCEVVRPDADIPMKVEEEPGGIGQISFSFLGACGHVKALRVDGQEPVPTNPDYPIARPLYLLWWQGRSRVAEFIAWTTTQEAQAVLLKRFALARPTGSPRRGQKLGDP